MTEPSHTEIMMRLYCCIINSHCKRLCYFLLSTIPSLCYTPTLLPLSSPGAHTLLRISSTPSLHELGKLTVDRVASQWEEVAPHLVVESCGVCKFGSGHLQEASRGALSTWLKGESDTDIAEKTRCSALEAQEANENIQLAEQRMLFEESSGEPVTSLASLLGMCVRGGGAECMHTVCNFHSLHYCEYLPMVVSPFSCTSVF